LRQDSLQRQRSAHLTNASDYSSWLTPTASEIEQDLEKFKKRMEKYPNGTTMPSLSNQVAEANNWTTPCSDDTGTRKKKYAQGGTALSMQASGLPDQGSPSTNGKNRELWPTTSMTDASPGINDDPKKWQKAADKHKAKGVNKQKFLCTKVAEQTRGKLNPNWVEQLMGLPVGWTGLGSWVTESSHSVRKKHLEP
jgi:hypothetical protein